MGRRSRQRERAPEGDPPGGTPRREARRRPSSEERNAAVRAQLEPVAPGERPGAVTVGAIVAAVLAAGNLVAYLAGLEINGEPPKLSALVASEILLWVMALGMWKARYWAVLGFQFLLGLLLVSLGLLLVVASSVTGVIVALAIGIPAGWLFWRLVKAMARIQMPERPGGAR